MSLQPRSQGFSLWNWDGRLNFKGKSPGNEVDVTFSTLSLICPPNHGQQMSETYGTAARMAKSTICSLDFSKGVKECNHLNSASSTWIRTSDLMKSMQMIFIMEGKLISTVHFVRRVKTQITKIVQWAFLVAKLFGPLRKPIRILLFTPDRFSHINYNIKMLIIKITIPLIAIFISKLLSDSLLS